jgi:hypothetical protein
LQKKVKNKKLPAGNGLPNELSFGLTFYEYASTLGAGKVALCEAIQMKKLHAALFVTLTEATGKKYMLGGDLPTDVDVFKMRLYEIKGPTPFYMLQLLFITPSRHQLSLLVDSYNPDAIKWFKAAIKYKHILFNFHFSDVNASIAVSFDFCDDNLAWLKRNLLKMRNAPKPLLNFYQQKEVFLKIFDDKDMQHYHFENCSAYDPFVDSGLYVAFATR